LRQKGKNKDKGNGHAKQAAGRQHLLEDAFTLADASAKEEHRADPVVLANIFLSNGSVDLKRGACERERGLFE
jgi:hypothetical protein